MLFEAHLLPQFKHACRVIQEAFLFATPHDKIFTKCGRSVGGGGGCRKPHFRAENWQIPKPKSIVGFHSRDQQPCFSTKTIENVCIKIELNSLRIRSGFQHGRRFFV